jgi:hypothetical protein
MRELRFFPVFRRGGPGTAPAMSGSWVQARLIWGGATSSLRTRAQVVHLRARLFAELVSLCRHRVQRAADGETAGPPLGLASGSSCLPVFFQLSGRRARIPTQELQA